MLLARELSAEPSVTRWIGIAESHMFHGIVLLFDLAESPSCLSSLVHLVIPELTLAGLKFSSLHHPLGSVYCMRHAGAMRYALFRTKHMRFGRDMVLAESLHWILLHSICTHGVFRSTSRLSNPMVQPSEHCSCGGLEHVSHVPACVMLS